MTQVKAVGYGLPIAGKQRYELQGHWSRNPKHGVQFEVETYDEVITPTREGIIAYLSSGQIKGIGPKMAEKSTMLSVLQHLRFWIKNRNACLLFPESVLPN